MNIKLVKDISSLKVFHLKIIYDKKKELLIYQRKLEKGSGPAIYGLEVCKSLNLPQDFDKPISFSIFWCFNFFSFKLRFKF